MVCIDDEIPFEIPASWEWCRITHLANSLLGKTLDRGKEQGKEYPYLCSINVYWNRIDLTKVKSCKLQENELERYRLQNGDLLICEGGDYGRCAVWDRDEEMYYQNALHRVRFFCNSSPSFFKNVFEFYRQVGYIVGQGQTIKHFTYENMKSLLFPLPPYKEQIRITNKLNQILELVNNYEESQERLDRINIQINDLLKKSILQEAIRGKLVSQDASEEPASILLQRIKEKKMNLVKEGKLKKRGVIDSTIFRGDDNKYYENLNGETIDITDQIPFDIPTSWQWVRLRALCNIATGASFKKEEASVEGANKVRILRGGNILPFRLQLKDNDIFINRELVNDNILLKQNDLVTPAVTSLENICKMARIEQDYGDMTMGGFVFIIRGFYNNEILAHYLQCVFSSPTTIEFVRSITNKSGQAFYNIGKERLSNTLIPIPPFDEMGRITSKIGTLFQSLN